MANCPTCGRQLQGSMPIHLAAAMMPPVMERIVLVLASAGGLSRRELADRVYADDPDGGPDTAENCISSTINIYRGRLAATGWRIRSSSWTGYWLEPVPNAESEDAA